MCLNPLEVRSGAEACGIHLLYTTALPARVTLNVRYAHAALWAIAWNPVEVRAVWRGIHSKFALARSLPGSSRNALKTVLADLLKQA